jgi:Glycosyltransferase family 87
MQKQLGLLRSRLPVIAAVGALLVLLFIGPFFKTFPPFADTRTITHSIDCLLAGQDPYLVRSFDPWQRVYNYPPIWLDARYLGVTSRSSNFIGTIMSITMAATLLFLFNARTWISAMIIFFAVLSRPVLAAMARGNTDQIVFFLLVFGLLLIERQKTDLKYLFKGLLIVLLTILKIYPVAAVAIFIRHRRGALRAILTAILSLAALVITVGHRLPVLLGNTPRDYQLSFGAYPFFLSISENALRHAVPIIQNRHTIAPIGAILLGVLATLIGAACGRRFDHFLPSIDFDTARGCIAIACLAIFCFAFTSGASYNYRLIFMLGTLAYLVDDMNQGVTLRSLPTAVLVVLLLWKPSPHLSLIGEVFDGMVFVVASAWLGNSLLSPGNNEDNPFIRSEAFGSI